MAEIAHWLCPVCSKERMKYGENCPKFPHCENQQYAHATGQWYLANEGKEKKATSVGIAEIAESINE